MRKLLLSVMFLFISTNIFGAELGAGGGSGYPAALDTDATPESGITIARSNVPNDLADAIINIQTELGTDPAGDAATVDNRISIRSCARAYLSADQDNLVDGVLTKILLDTESFDVGNDFDTATSSFTVPYTGYYQISASIRWEADDMVADKTYLTYIKKNDLATTIIYSTNQSSLAGAVLKGFISDTVHLTAGDTIAMWAVQNSGGDTIDVDGVYDYTTFMSIRFLTQ